ncbi:MAG: Maf family protein [Alphaproteobacteria bacterium]|nr:Maf family protein [Alphaproteobacteria bacterium]
MALILASASSMRQKLLAQIGVTPDEIYPCHIDETPHKNEQPRQYAIRMAYEKAMKASEMFAEKNASILTGDTVITCGRRILGKPADEAQAYACLQLLSGRAHRCYCAVCLIDNNGKISRRINLTRIVFKNLSADEITQYLASGQWQGRAGGYHIYGMAQKFIIKLNGSASAVAGLPLYETAQLLRGHNLL